tara:strand:+ start:2608 stop:3114 length:507 start_codon:yes stop_codon:yes gene_type:complete
MNLNQPELLRLLELLGKSNKLIKKAPSRSSEEYFEFNENLFTKLSVEFAKKTIEKDPIVETMVPTYKVGDFHFTSSTAQTAKKLKVTESDLRVLRNTSEMRGGLRKDFHYTTGKYPRPNAVWYDLNRTCLVLHEVDYKTFSQPGFDVQANTNKNTARAFERARKGMKR